MSEWKERPDDGPGYYWQRLEGYPDRIVHLDDYDELWSMWGNRPLENWEGEFQPVQPPTDPAPRAMTDQQIRERVEGRRKEQR